MALNPNETFTALLSLREPVDDFIAADAELYSIVKRLKFQTYLIALDDVEVLS
jgi:hypothetical protein